MTVRFLAALPLATLLGLVTSGCMQSEADSTGYREVTGADVTPPESITDPAQTGTAEPSSPESDNPPPVVPGGAVATTGDGTATTTPGTTNDAPVDGDDVPAAGANTGSNDTTADSGDQPVVAETGADTPDPNGTNEPAGTPQVNVASADTDPETASETVTVTVAQPRQIELLVPTREFKAEGPDNALRVSFDDVDLLKILNMEPVIANAPELLPKWLSALDGKRVRLRGFMYPPFQDTDLEAFILARDNQICCFGRDPKVYDLVRVLMRDGVTTDYIESRPFDVVGTFRIGDDASIPGKLYTLDDSIVISR